MRYRLRNIFWALLEQCKRKPSFGLRRGCMFIREERVDAATRKNGIVRIATGTELTQSTTEGK